MKRFSLPIILLALALPAHSDPFKWCQNKNPKWFTCEKDDDCVIISNPCGHPTAAANKKYSREAERCNIHQGAALSCASWNEMLGGKTRPVCTNKICFAEKLSRN